MDIGLIIGKMGKLSLVCSALRRRDHCAKRRRHRWQTLCHIQGPSFYSISLLSVLFTHRYHGTTTTKGEKISKPLSHHHHKSKQSIQGDQDWQYSRFLGDTSALENYLKQKCQEGQVTIKKILKDNLVMYPIIERERERESRNEEVYITLYSLSLYLCVWFLQVERFEKQWMEYSVRYGYGTPEASSRLAFHGSLFCRAIINQINLSL